MPARIFGVLSLIAAGVAVMLALFVAWRQSTLLGLAYAALVLVSLIAITALFCTKCSDRDRCGHVVFGPVARVMRREQRPDSYTRSELAMTSIALALTFLLPQVWLWRVPLALAGFWLCLLLGSIDIRARVCPACGNAACPLSQR
ncbi:MAG: hypothetical protein ABSC51_02780 [Gaiellaceae bacterium]|jgi:hypothetical protein